MIGSVIEEYIRLVPVTKVQGWQNRAHFIFTITDTAKARNIGSLFEPTFYSAKGEYRRDDLVRERERERERERKRKGKDREKESD